MERVRKSSLIYLFNNLSENSHTFSHEHLQTNIFSVINSTLFFFSCVLHWALLESNMEHLAHSVVPVKQVIILKTPRNKRSPLAKPQFWLKWIFATIHFSKELFGDYGNWSDCSCNVHSTDFIHITAQSNMSVMFGLVLHEILKSQIQSRSSESFSILVHRYGWLWHFRTSLVLLVTPVLYMLWQLKMAALNVL